MHVLKLALEDLVQVEIPIEVNLVGANVNKLIKVDVVGVKTLKVTGAESVVKTLDKAVVSVDITDRTTSFTETVSATIYDRNGALVPMAKLKLNNQVEVQGIAHVIKSVPVKVSLVEQSRENKFYYELLSCELSAETVDIAAPADLIDTIDTLELTIIPDDNAEVLSTMLFKLNNYLPEGFVLAPSQDEEYSVNVNMIKYQKVSLPVTKEDVRISGMLETKFEALVVEVTGEIEFFVNTSLIAATDVSVDMLKPYIIVTNTNKLGLYSSDLRIENVDGIVINSTATVKYEITNKDGA